MRICRAIRWAGSLLILAAAVFSIWFSFIFFSAPSGPQEKRFFTIEKGQNVRDVASHLKERDFIRSKWAFLFGYRLFFSSRTLKAGEYELLHPLSSRGILTALSEGRVVLRPVTIPEGLTRRETVQLLSTELMLDEYMILRLTEKTGRISDLDPKAENLEGYLFPETYYFPRDSEPEDVVNAMVRQFRSVFSEEWQQRANELEMSIREVVVMASLIEKETAVPSERTLVSSVFHNRLKLGMKLDCDPTIIYALKEKGEYTGNIRRRDLRMDDPYNTYLFRGLPPGPIANPGRDSLEAALFHENTKYLYFVSRNDGSHIFSETFAEHQKAVNKYQRNR